MVQLNELRKPPVFVAVVLDTTSRNKLLAWWEETTGRDLLKKVYAHHMTIKFKPSTAEIDSLPMGERITLDVVGWADNGKVQAVAVKGFKSANKIPHITMATNGTPPKFANDLLEAGYTRVRGPQLVGVVKGGQ